MHGTSAATAGAVTFVWLGMVLAISFLEAPLTFRAPGVTIPVGLDIGRIVFRALNLAEIVLALVVVVAVAVGAPPTAVVVLTVVVLGLLAAQLGVVRPRLNRRSDPGARGGGSAAFAGHLSYVALEVAKVCSLVALGVTVLSR